MCFAVYIGTDKELELGTFVPEQTDIYFEKLSDEEETALRLKFSKTNIYYVGSDTSCSCGLVFESEDFDDPDEQTNKKSPQRFIDFFDTVCWCLSILGLINIVISSDTILLIRNAVTGNPMDFSISISVGSVISIGIIIAAASVIVIMITKNAFHVGKTKKYRLKVFFIGAGLTALLLLIVLLGRTTLFTVNIFIACAVVLVLYVAHKILERF